MKRKYYYIFAVIIVLVAMVIIPSFSKPIPPENPFPISEEAINTAIKNAGLEVTLGEKSDISNDTINSLGYFLMNDNNKIVAVLTITHHDTAKMISAVTMYHTFLVADTSRVSDLLPEEDFPKLAHMVSELYGGFSDNNTPYDTFKKAGPAKFWNKKFSGKLCTVFSELKTHTTDVYIPSQITIFNEATLDFQIAASEKAIQATIERLEKFPERNTKEAQEHLASQKESLERFKKMK